MNCILIIFIPVWSSLRANLVTYSSHFRSSFSFNLRESYYCCLQAFGCVAFGGISEFVPVDLMIIGQCVYEESFDQNFEKREKVLSTI